MVPARRNHPSGGGQYHLGPCSPAAAAVTVAPPLSAGDSCAFKAKGQADVTLTVLAVKRFIAAVRPDAAAMGALGAGAGAGRSVGGIVLRFRWYLGADPPSQEFGAPYRVGCARSGMPGRYRCKWTVTGSGPWTAG